VLVRVAGTDVWKGKWIVVVLDDLRIERAFFVADIAAVVAELDDCVSIGVDMPIGLPPAGVSRDADLEARVLQELICKFAHSGVSDEPWD
jgi:predicted RNase H-like nuclease